MKKIYNYFKLRVRKIYMFCFMRINIFRLRMLIRYIITLPVDDALKLTTKLRYKLSHIKSENETEEGLCILYYNLVDDIYKILKVKKEFIDEEALLLQRFKSKLNDINTTHACESK